MEDGHPDKSNKRDEIFRNFFKTLNLVRNLSNDIEYKPIQGSNERKVLVIGNIGNGKSTLLNKFSQVLYGMQNGTGPSDQSPFEARKATKSVTTDVKYEQIGNFQLIDSPGFGDPLANQSELWFNLIKDILENEKGQVD